MKLIQLHTIYTAWFIIDTEPWDNHWMLFTETLLERPESTYLFLLYKEAVWCWQKLGLALTRRLCLSFCAYGKMEMIFWYLICLMKLHFLCQCYPHIYNWKLVKMYILYQEPKVMYSMPYRYVSLKASPPNWKSVLPLASWMGLCKRIRKVVN